VSRVLVVSHEALYERMSGPSIRNWELARALAHDNSVTLAAPGRPARRGDGFNVVGYDHDSLPELVRGHEVAVCSAFLLHENPAFLEAEFLVVDLYGPFALESLHQLEDRTVEDRLVLGDGFRNVVRGLVRAADMIMCASERQRDFWLGWLDASGRVSVLTHDADPGFSSLVRVVPFGLAAEPPVSGPPRFRGVISGIGTDSLVVLWGGGIWNWFDPLTLIRAADATRETLPQLRVVFPASGSPSEKVPAMQMALDARELADSLGLTGTRVFFGDAWVPYEDRGSMFLEADIGISLHREDIETRFSFRTRVLDYLWAGLPVVTTEGDSMADLVANHDLGEVVEYGSVDALTAALRALADPDRRRQCGARSAALAGEFHWAKVAAPLLEFCANPRQAPDRELARAGLGGAPAEPATAPVSELGRLGRRSIDALRQGGPQKVALKGREYLRRRWGK
jgi:glycosyltransferase involved in cell wall biosynthesis